MYDQIKNLKNLQDQVRFICDRLEELKREIDIGKVWDNKIFTDNNSAQILNLTEQSVNMEFQVATLEINAF